MNATTEMELLKLRQSVCSGGAKLTGGMLAHQTCACRGCNAILAAFELGKKEAL